MDFASVKGFYLPDDCTRYHKLDPVPDTLFLGVQTPSSRWQLLFSKSMKTFNKIRWVCVYILSSRDVFLILSDFQRIVLVLFHNEQVLCDLETWFSCLQIQYWHIRARSQSLGLCQWVQLWSSASVHHGRHRGVHDSVSTRSKYECCL